MAGKLSELVLDGEMAKSIFDFLKANVIAWLYGGVIFLKEKSINLLGGEDGMDEVRWALLFSPWR